MTKFGAPSVRIDEHAVICWGPVASSPHGLVVPSELTLYHAHLFLEGFISLGRIDVREAIVMAVDDHLGLLSGPILKNEVLLDAGFSQ